MMEYAAKVNVDIQNPLSLAGHYKPGSIDWETMLKQELWCKLGKPYHFLKEMISSKSGGLRIKPIYLEGENILENIFSFCEKHYILKEDYQI